VPCDVLAANGMPPGRLMEEDERAPDPVTVDKAFVFTVRIGWTGRTLALFWTAVTVGVATKAA